MFQCRLLLCDFVFSLSFFSLSFLNQEKCIFVDVKNNARYMRTKRVAHSFAMMLMLLQMLFATSQIVFCFYELCDEYQAIFMQFSLSIKLQNSLQFS